MAIKRIDIHLAGAALAVAIAVAAAGRAAAQAVPPAVAPPIDLAGVMAQARAQGREVAASRSRETAAAERVKLAKAFRLPQIRLQEQWIRTDSPAESFALRMNQERFSFPAFVGSNPNDPGFSDTALTRLEVELPIWTGGELTARVRQAGLAAAAATDTAAYTGDAAALAAAEAWVQLAQAREYVELLAQSRGTVAAHVELARAYSEQGMLVRSELLRAEVELARIDDLLAEARGHARVAEANLAFRLGQPVGTSYQLVALGEPPALKTPHAEWLAAAAERRDLLAAQKLLGAGELEVTAQKATRWPRVGLVARHDLVDDSPFGRHGDSTTIVALASFDLFSGGRKRAAIAAAEAEAAAGRQDVARFADGVRLAVEQAFAAAEVAAERRATAQQALAAAAEAVRITEERFRAGVVKTLDLLDAVTARREAQTRELVARADAHLAALRLAVVAGRPPESVLTSAAPAAGDAVGSLASTSTHGGDQ